METLHWLAPEAARVRMAWERLRTVLERLAYSQVTT